MRAGSILQRRLQSGCSWLEEENRTLRVKDLYMWKLSICLLVMLSLFSAAGLYVASASGPAEIEVLDNRFVIKAEGNTGTPRCVFFVPHSNETIGASAARNIVQNWSHAALYQLRPCNSDVKAAMEGSGVTGNDPYDRYLYFSFDRLWYSIDPNRIYTPRGIDREILLFGDGKWGRKVDLGGCAMVPAGVKSAVSNAAKGIINAIGIGSVGPSCPAVVAVHNNTPTEEGDLETFSFLWYKNGGPCSNEVEKRDGDACIYEGDAPNRDNLILVTRFEDFQYLAKDGRFNIVLMRTPAPGAEGDDGSLSVYCGQKGIRYINVEARYMDRTSEENIRNGEYQGRMLQLVRQMVEAR